MMRPPNLLEALLHLADIEKLVRPYEYVARACLLDHLACGPSPVVQLQDVKPVGASQHVTHLADLHALQGLEKQRRQLARLAPTQPPTLQRILARGELRRRLAKIEARVDAA